MKFVQQRSKLNIINLDKLVNQNKKFKTNRKHGELLPENIRCIICGPSNCGKTNVLLNLLFSPKGLFFENIYIFSKSLFQPKYKFLQCVLEEMNEIGYFPFTDNEHVPFPTTVKTNSIMIFDDITCEKQNNVKNYFSMGRHMNIDSFHICQTYSFIPKQLVRDNVNLLIVFQQDDRNLHHIFNDHVSGDMTFIMFKNMCTQIWKTGHNKFVVIDKERNLNDGRYRSGFDVFIQF